MTDPPIVNAYADGDRVVLLSRGPDGRLRERRIPAEYVSFHRIGDVSADVQRRLRGHRSVRSCNTEGGWLRIGWRNWEERKHYLRAVNDQGQTNPYFGAAPSYEGDVHPVKRYMIDSGVRIQRPKRLWFDLETDSRVPFVRAREGLCRILSWSAVDEEGNLWSDILADDDDAAERALLSTFWELAAHFDQLTAWNGDGFDFPVLLGRSKLQRCRIDPRRWLYLDHLAVYKRMNSQAAESGDEKTSMKLQDVAVALLGEGKDDFDGSKTWQAWSAGGAERARLLAYNEKDTDLLRKVEHKTGYLELLFTLADACGVFPDSRGLQPGSQVDAFLLRLARERHDHFPTRIEREVGEKFRGAWVLHPAPDLGIQRDVHVADFRRLYPSVMITWNLSPETKVGAVAADYVPAAGECVAPTTRIGFTVDKEGMLPSALKRLIDLRDFWGKKKSALPPGTPEWEDADRRDKSYKVAANSFYGVIGSPFSRFFDKEIAESITQTGVWLIKETLREAEARGMKVIYADTDSLFATGCTVDAFRAFTVWCNDELYPRLVRECGCAVNDIYIAYEKAFERIVFTSAKKYAGRYLHYKGKAATADSKPEIKGLEYKRGDSAMLARRLQQAVINLLMSGSERLEDYHDLLARAQTHVLVDPLTPREVVLSKTLSRELGAYVIKQKNDGTAAAQPRHVQVGKVLAGRGAEVTEGTRIGFIVLDAGSKPTIVIPAEDFDGTCDRHYLWERMVFPSTMRVLEAAFPKHDWRAWGKTRPAKPRAARAKKAATETRVSVNTPAAVPPVPARPRRSHAPIHIRPLAALTEEAMAALSGMLAAASDGQRPVYYWPPGEGDGLKIDMGCRVAGTPALLASIAALVGPVRQ